MNKKNNRSIVILLVVVGAFLLFFCGLTLGTGPASGVINESQWTGGDGSTWFSVLLAIAFCVLVDQMLFNKRE
jgi:hypothetical protein